MQFSHAEGYIHSHYCGVKFAKGAVTVCHCYVALGL